MSTDSGQEISQREGARQYSIDDRRSDARGVHRVAVTVFATARGHDRRQAAMAARMAVHSAIAGAGSKSTAGYTRVEVDGAVSRFAPSDTYVVVDVHEVVDTGVALAGGYLWCEPTTKAFAETADFTPAVEDR